MSSYLLFKYWYTKRVSLREPRTWLHFTTVEPNISSCSFNCLLKFALKYLWPNLNILATILNGDIGYTQKSYIQCIVQKLLERSFCANVYIRTCTWEYRLEITEFSFSALADEITKIAKENKNTKNGILSSTSGFFLSYSRISSGQSGCLKGCATLNASSLVKSSCILEMVGNWDISTLNLSQERQNQRCFKMWGTKQRVCETEIHLPKKTSNASIFAGL